MIALVLALMVELLGRGAARVAPASAIPGSDELSAFVRPLASRQDVSPRATVAAPTDDPFTVDGRRVAGPTTTPTTTATPDRPAGRLTAILIANDGSVAVIDEEAVAVGGRLRTGERVASIQPDRVWVVTPNGQWRALTLPARGR